MFFNNLINIAFLGDISFNDAYIGYYKNGLNPFTNVQPLLQSKDYVIGNLECMAKGEQGENLLRKPRLTTTVETLGYLKTLNVNIVSLAQNHVYDHLEDGFTKTTSFLEQNKIEYFGASLNKSDFDKPVIINKNGIGVGLLNYVTHDTNPKIPPDARVYVNFFSEEKAIADISELKKKHADHVVLLLHWGGRVEGGILPDFDQPQIAKRLIDAGADLIIGHHSHTVQPYEVYKGKYIFYGVGNFCFADYIFEGKLNPLPYRQYISAVISVAFEKESYEVALDFYLNKKNFFTKLNFLPKLKRRNKYFKVVFKSYYLWKFYFLYKRKLLPLFVFIKRKDISSKEKIFRVFGSLKRRVSQ